jgi:hypothetical protein
MATNDKTSTPSFKFALNVTKQGKLSSKQAAKLMIMSREPYVSKQAESHKASCSIGHTICTTYFNM